MPPTCISILPKRRHGTSLFRDPEAFWALQRTVFPQLLAEKTQGEPARIRVPGCSTGPPMSGALRTAAPQCVLENAGGFDNPDRGPATIAPSRWSL
jgi:hypothetical protein